MTESARTGDADLDSLIDRQAPVPMYHQLKHHIMQQINIGALVPGDMLPGEHRLCEQFGVSRTVVRQALSQLEHQGIIERVKGKGTFVAPKKTPEGLVHTLSGLFDEMAQRGIHVHSDVRRKEVEPASDLVAEALELTPGEPVVVLDRLRYVGDEPWSWSTTYMPLDIGSLALEADLRDTSLYALLGEHGIRTARGVRSAEAVSASAEAAELLRVDQGRALLVLRSVGYDGADRPIEFFIAYHRGDRSRFEFQLTASPEDTSTAALLHTGFEA
ncbi:GntR family transcriptional regulator [Paramicrobacterium humi]|uniref:GntR family transcriptional regulator n=1 Tax=Paramicrobacterium humi TaxID=640635 RepID=A0A1H4LZY1_9MICO|nr:GntR family transcriptional regulator [Microbacterium humi]SEB76044.1 GntR family transcriptional regulator [Microbacterium humi]